MSMLNQANVTAINQATSRMVTASQKKKASGRSSQVQTVYAVMKEYEKYAAKCSGWLQLN